MRALERISIDGIYLHQVDATVWAQGHTDTSHGCLNLNADNAKWFYNFSVPGDVVEVGNSSGPPVGISGAKAALWFVNSGNDFQPQDAVPVGPGGYVKRTARTPHYDGVPTNQRDPAVIAVFGLGPVDMQLVDPTQPSWRQV